MAELSAAWLTPENQRWAMVIQRSHQRAFGRGLLPGHLTTDQSRTAVQSLFSCSDPVLAHNGNQDPTLIYANAAALLLWRRRWNAMVGMPSRLTAPEQERRERAQALGSSKKVDAFEGYRGIRMDREGRKFVIDNARIWTLWDEQGERCGQAASFARWWWI